MKNSPCLEPDADAPLLPLARANTARLFRGGHQAAAGARLQWGTSFRLVRQEGAAVVYSMRPTPQDGKLSVEELVKMLAKAGLALPSERMEMLVRAFDENGDGALDLGEFSTTSTT